MLNDVMTNYSLIKDFRNIGYFETQHHKEILAEIKNSIRLGKLIAITGIVGCGKTVTLQKIRKTLSQEKEIIVAKSLSIDKARVTLPTLMMALFFDLATEKDFKPPSQPEKRERMLQDMIAKRKKPVALFIDEAHDLHGKTLIGLKRLIEMAQDGGGVLSVILAGHPKLKNDLRRATLEEIGSRTTIFDLEGITASKREYIQWVIAQSVKKTTAIDNIISPEAIDTLAEKLLTPLQIEHYLTLAFEQGYKIGAKQITQEIIESVFAKDLDDLEPRLMRYGYNIKAISTLLNARPAVIRSFLKGKLPPGQIQEIQTEMLAAGIPV